MTSAGAACFNSHQVPDFATVPVPATRRLV